MKRSTSPAFVRELLAEIDSYSAQGGLSAAALSTEAGFCTTFISTIRRRGHVTEISARALRMAMRDNPPSGGIAPPGHKNTGWIPEGDLTVRQHGSTYAVFAGRNRISGALGTRSLAEAMIERLERERSASRRPCITCRQPFASEGPHNRMCDNCRQLSLYDGAA